MLPRFPRNHHPAFDMLWHFATAGCPVNCGANWTPAELATAIRYGSHRSAQAPDAASDCRNEALERVADGCCRLIPWTSLRRNPPPNLKISPIAAIPHKSRKFRMILDLSWAKPLPSNPELLSVNDASDKKLAPQHSMFELGNVIPRLVHAMATTADQHTPFRFMKIDLKDGYWRMVVNETDAWNFAYVLPKIHPSAPTELVVPTSIQMGWSESPAFFCAATETARDLAEQRFQLPTPQPEHHMEDIVMESSPIADTPLPTPRPLTLIEVYLDDFIAATQSTNLTHLRQVARCLLHAIEDVFPGPDVTGSKLGPAISHKKLLAEGTWTTQKEILGWLFDGETRTIQLPPAKYASTKQRLLEALNTKTIPLKHFQKMHGKLQHAAIAIPNSKPLMGPLDAVIADATRANNTTVTISPSTRLFLQDWQILLKDTATRPTHVRELILHPACYRGFVDASGWGIGGVWFPGTHPIRPFVWFVQWPRDIAAAIVTDTNPSGTLSISDLELAGILFHYIALETALATAKSPLRHASPAIWCDNIAAVAWTHKNRTSTSSVAARLLRALATRIRANEGALLNVQHVSGKFNVMADAASRPHPTDPHEFLLAFSAEFPPPQAESWTLFLPNNTLKSRLFSELRQQHSPLAWWKRLRGRESRFGHNGPTGFTTISPEHLRTCTALPPLPSSKFWLPTPNMCVPDAFTKANQKFAPSLSRWHYAPSPRPSVWTANKVPWERRKTVTRRKSNNFWRAIDAKIHLQNLD